MAKSHGSQVKDDEQYEAMRDKGMSKNKAARIANSNARSGSSNQASKKGGKSAKYEDKTKKELQEQAAKVGIDGRSKMDKGELISAWATAERRAATCRDARRARELNRGAGFEPGTSPRRAGAVPRAGAQP
jgi:hypothetical protein